MRKESFADSLSYGLVTLLNEAVAGTLATERYLKFGSEFFVLSGKNNPAMNAMVIALKRRNAFRRREGKSIHMALKVKF